ncbi:MAG: hypothetical protein LBS35_03390, partial [Synergistaceae bacterium]|nr:hypothetical protein [Synergistaceae bacterium]
MDMKRPPARSHLPPEAAKNLERHILAESRAPKTLVGYFLDRLGGDIAMTETVEPDKLRLTLTFADKTGELGR